MPRRTTNNSSTGSNHQFLLAANLKWKRRFFASTDYQSINDMVDDSLTNADSRLFLQCCLGLRVRKEYRHSFEDVVAQRRLGDRKAKWFKPLMRTIFQVYCNERALAIQSTKREAADMRSMTRRQRASLAIPGVLTARRTSTKKRAAENRAKVTSAMTAAGGLVWIDNFNKFRYARNVNAERDQCINGTVMSVLPMPSLKNDL